MAASNQRSAHDLHCRIITYRCSRGLDSVSDSLLFNPCDLSAGLLVVLPINLAVRFT